MRLFADFTARRRDRIGAWRQRPRYGAQVLGGQRDREHGDQVDELPADDPFLGLDVLDQLFNVIVAGLRRVSLDRLERQGGNVARSDKFGTQSVVTVETGKQQQFVDVS